jgi:L-Ala-D/L-Glu epimerase
MERLEAIANRPLALEVVTERFPLAAPFHITGHTMTQIEVVLVTLAREGCRGRGEASGVFYHSGDDPPAIVAQIDALRPRIEAGLDRSTLQELLPAGGARNALDCALWDLEAQLLGIPAWRTAGLKPPRSLLTTFTVSANTPEKMAEVAGAYAQAKAIKIKLTGADVDAERVRAIRDVRLDVWLGVDGNQGFTLRHLESLLPVLTECDVKLIEQPFRIGQDSQLAGFDSPIPIAADESAQTPSDVPALVGRFDVVNIKLDKCGGLTAGLEMAHLARQLGLEVMVGNMIGTSLAMAPAFVLGQLCDVVDLDGPIFLTHDRTPSVRYENGAIICPAAIWGGTGTW